MAYIGNQPLSVAFLTDQFSGNGSTTAFTLSVAPANTGSILVAVSGVLQDPSTYAVTNTTLTFSAAPPAGTGNISVRYLGIPASGVTTTAYRTVTEFTATAGQTTFSVPSYTVGYIDVYRNGVRLGAADYTATSGTSVILANPCTAGDLVVTESFYVSSVLNAIPATAGAVNSTYLASGLTLTSPSITGAVVSSMASSVITSASAQASTSGTAIDFTGIPSWVKRITVMFNGVSRSGTAATRFQLGTSGGIESSGYSGSSSYISTGVGTIQNSAGFDLQDGGGTGVTTAGTTTFYLLGSNTWVTSGVFGRTDSTMTWVLGGAKTLSGILDRVRITTTNGTDTFDAGSINILYE